MSETKTTDERVVRRTDASTAATSESRKDRSTEDNERTSKDGTAMTIEERKRLLRQEWSDDILPHIQGDPQYHYCWLSTTNQTDPIYRRLRMGYELVKYSELPHLGQSSRIESGEFSGCIAVNEMILSKIDVELYQELMLINHHEKPLQEEELLRANIELDEEDSSGRKLAQTEGEGIQNLVKKTRKPTFD